MNPGLAAGAATSGFACRECRRHERQRHSRCAGCGKWHTLVPVSELPPEAPSTFAPALGIVPASASGLAPSSPLSMHDWPGVGATTRPSARAVAPAYTPYASTRSASVPTPITEIEAAAHYRYSTGIEGLDRVCGVEPVPPIGSAPAGCVRGGIYLLSGLPGIGKSTLLMQMISCMAGDAPVLYASGEEASAQIATRAHRLGAARPNILLVSETDLDAILAHACAVRPRLLIVDSISTIATTRATGIAGSVTQVKECAGEIARYAQDPAHPVTVIMIGHVTQDGKIAGPKTLQHLVDAVLELEEYAPKSDLRTLAASKNRFGSTFEKAAFRMTQAGLVEVDADDIAAADAERDAAFQPIAQELLNRYLAIGGQLDDGLRGRIDERLDLEMWRETRYPQ